MTRTVLLILLALVLAAPGQAGSALAQGKVSAARLEELRVKVEYQRDSYLRFEAAEKEALADGYKDKAEIYKAARLKAYEAYVAVNAEYQRALLDQRDQKRRETVQNPDYR